MLKRYLIIENIPAILWGTKSDKIYIFVHGKMSNKEEAESFAIKAAGRGFQVLSFDLPGHGERKDGNYPCTVWNAVHDLDIIGEYVYENWNAVSLFSCSLGAYFSLLAYKNVFLQKCLFLSPILDMVRLIENMMRWSDISHDKLKEKGEIPTPIGETLSWKYYCYAKEHPIINWNVPTAILYGSKDNLAEPEAVKAFSEKFNCNLTILEGSEHYFHTEKQLAFYEKWLDENI